MLTHNDLRLTRREVPLARLPQAFEGLKIVQVSDLHFYEYSDDAYYRRVLEAINAESPDVVAVTGDIIHYGGHCLHRAEAFLSGIRAGEARLCVLGNHDFYDDAQSEAIRAMWQRLGFELLVNRHRLLQRSGERLWFVGLDDLWYGTPDIPRALEGVPSQQECTVALAHNPLLFDPLAHYRQGRIDLVLAGHTHAGHVYIPVLGPIYRKIFRMKYRYGLYQKKQTRLHVTSGVGSAAFYLKKQRIGLPRFRFNTHPEVAVLTLVGDPAARPGQTNPGS